MNERIKELLHASFDNCDGTLTERVLSLKPSELEKFALSIVNECFKAAMIESKGHMNPIDLMNRMNERVGVDKYAN